MCEEFRIAPWPHYWSHDPRLPVLQSLISSGTTISQLFDQDKWENHRSVQRYTREIFKLPRSTVLRRITKPCTIVTGVRISSHPHRLCHSPLIIIRRVASKTNNSSFTSDATGRSSPLPLEQLCCPGVGSKARTSEHCPGSLDLHSPSYHARGCHQSPPGLQDK